MNHFEDMIPGDHMTSPTVVIDRDEMVDFDDDLAASFGYDEVRFHHPLRPGDEVYLRYDCVEARPSSSKPDRGVVTVRLSLNGDDEVVMSHLDTILVHRRPPQDS